MACVHFSFRCFGRIVHCICIHCHYSSHNSTELREYINIKLTNTGLDQINMAIKRLESKREKRANKDTLTESEKKRCRRSNIELLELRTDELRVRVDEIHRDATMFQREIKELLRSENESLLDARENEEEHVATFVNNGSNPRRMRRKENISEYDWDRHQHASRRRNPSIRATAQKGNNKEYTDQNEYGVSETRPRAENKSNSLKSYIAPDTECRLASESIECNAFLRNQSTNIEFIGDTDDHDDGNGLPELDINAYRRGTSRKRPVIGSRGSGRVSHENRSKSGQNQAFMGAQIINNRRVEQGVKIHGRKTPREATNTAKKQKRQSRLEVSPKGKSSRYSTRDGNTTHRLNTDAPSNIERRQINIASHARDSASDFEGRTLPNPGIPDFLSADGLFESLVHRQENAESPGENMTLHPHDIRSCDELCQLLVDYYPHKLQSCREILRTLSKSVYDMPTEPKNQGVVILQTLLGIFQRKSSTFLDLLQFDPQDACFQIDCWSLVFRLMQMNFHLKLQKEDGVVHTVFSKKEQLADHILLLMIDVVYSQLFWEEWGWTRRVGPEMIDCMW